jgi:hypothetical protein
MRQPKVIGEILAGIVLGSALLGRLPFAAHIVDAAKHQGNILDFIYWLGLLLLMFLSGAETRQLFTRDERREVGWLTIVGTGLPFLLALGFGSRLIRPSLAGPNGNRISLIIILAVGVAVTSVPVVSKIFADPQDSAHTLCPPGAGRSRARRHCPVARAGGRCSRGGDGGAAPTRDGVASGGDGCVLRAGAYADPARGEANQQIAV